VSLRNPVLIRAPWGFVHDDCQLQKWPLLCRQFAATTSHHLFRWTDTADDHFKFMTLIYGHPYVAVNINTGFNSFISPTINYVKLIFPAVHLRVPHLLKSVLLPYEALVFHDIYNMELKIWETFK